MQRSTLLTTLLLAARASKPNAPESPQLSAAITAEPEPESIPASTSVSAVEHVDAGVQQEAVANPSRDTDAELSHLGFAARGRS